MRGSPGEIRLALTANSIWHPGRAVVSRPQDNRAGMPLARKFRGQESIPVTRTWWNGRHASPRCWCPVRDVEVQLLPRAHGKPGFEEAGGYTEAGAEWKIMQYGHCPVKYETRADSSRG